MSLFSWKPFLPNLERNKYPFWNDSFGMVKKGVSNSRAARQPAWARKIAEQKKIMLEFSQLLEESKAKIAEVLRGEQESKVHSLSNQLMEKSKELLKAKQERVLQKKMMVEQQAYLQRLLDEFKKRDKAVHQLSAENVHHLSVQLQNSQNEASMLSQKLSNAESRIQQAAKDHDAAIQLVAKSSEAKIAELHNLHAGQELSFRSSIEQLKEKLYRQQQIMGRKQMSEAVLMRDINKKFADLLSLKSPASEML